MQGGQQPRCGFHPDIYGLFSLASALGYGSGGREAEQSFFLVFFLSSNVHSRCQQVLRCPGWTGAARLHRLHQCKSAARVSSAGVTSWQLS